MQGCQGFHSQFPWSRVSGCESHIDKLDCSALRQTCLKVRSSRAWIQIELTGAHCIGHHGVTGNCAGIVKGIAGFTGWVRGGPVL